MAARLTNEEKNKIIADRAAGASLRELAGKYGTSVTTIHRTISGNPEMEKLVTEKMEKDAVDLIAYMDTKRAKVYQIVDTYLDALLDDVKIEKANPAQLTTALGTLIDKWTMSQSKSEKGDGDRVQVIIDV